MKMQTGSSNFLTATGGTVTTSGNFKIHTFTGPGTFCVSLCRFGANDKSRLFSIAGGGSGGAANNNNNAGGGGAKGYRESNQVLLVDTYTASPLEGYPSLTNSNKFSNNSWWWRNSGLQERMEIQDQVQFQLFQQ